MLGSWATALEVENFHRDQKEKDAQSEKWALVNIYRQGLGPGALPFGGAERAGRLRREYFWQDDAGGVARLRSRGVRR